MKLLLIATTALVCVTSLATAGTLPERQAGSGYSQIDSNGEFLCNYGFKIRAFASAQSSNSFYHSWVRAAVPVIGEGKPVNAITVEDSPSGGRNDPGFQVAIYESHRDRPSKHLIVKEHVIKHRCGRVTVPISPITLKKGKKYWVVERAFYFHVPSANSVIWVYDTKRTHGALSQSAWTRGWGGSYMLPRCSSSSFCSSYRSPWKPIRGGVPYVRLRESAEPPELNRPPPPRGASNGSLAPAIIPTRRASYQDSNPRYPP